MNHHFSSRVLSLVLAVVFLFSAAGVSFLILFKGTSAFAEEPAPERILACSGYQLYTPVTSTTDPLEPYLNSVLQANDTFAIKLLVTDSELAKYPGIANDANFMNNMKVRIKNNGFSIVSPTRAAFSDLAVSDGVATYSVTLKNVKFTGEGQLLDFFITYPEYSYQEPGASPDQSPTTKVVTPSAASLSIRISECTVTSSSSEHIRNDRDDDDDDKSSSSRPDIAPPTPTLIVSTFDYGGQGVTAAGNFTLKLTVKNTSKKLPIDNIVVKVTVPEAFTMNGSTNTFYIEKLLKDSSKELTLNLSVKPNAEPISHAIKISFAFEAVIDEARKALTSDQEISIPVGQLDRFSVQPIEIPQEIFMGEDTSFEVSFINKGKTTVYNITAEIAGAITQPGQRQFIGNLEGGKEDSADFMIGATAPGPLTGEVIITYEDANMHVTELRQPFNTNVIQMDMGKPEGGDMEVDMAEQPAQPAQWYQQVPPWGWMVGGVVALILLAFIVKLIRARREKKLEEQDEDF